MRCASNYFRQAIHLKQVCKGLVLSLNLLLMSCDSAPKLSEVCENEPEICQLLQEDNWCKAERKASLYNYANIRELPEDENKYNLLLSYEDYIKCMDLASMIEHKKLKEKKTKRIKNVINAKRLMSDLSEHTLHSESPLLLYYHWSRNLNKLSLNKLLALEGSEQLENSRSQYHMATYYIKRDRAKTFNFLFHSLELHQPDQKINVNIFRSLSTLFLDQKNYQQAYIWLKVIDLYSPEQGEKKAVLEGMVTGYQLDHLFLDKVAASTLAKIKQGNFTKPK